MSAHVGSCSLPMSTYSYELPTTGAIFFAGVCEDRTGSYTTEIAEATEARANLRATLKESKRVDDGGKDYLKLVKVNRRPQTRCSAHSY